MAQADTPEPAQSGELLGREFASAMVNFHEVAGRLMGLSATERKCIDTLQRLGPVTAGTIAESTGLTTGAVTGLVDRLEQAGYARRVRDPLDRRKVIVQLVANEQMDNLLAEIFRPFIRDMNALNDGYSEAELRVIGDWVRKTTDVLIANTRRIANLKSL
ncbi:MULTISPECIES: MarR family winged helix-turn-helix transcriptional regulator [unclassified Nocardia]|uniref:MarR family winged helix-turn-helix transcriptional regulator n=1 Tax=unclassified Nocardia TaxID=2637762 RepID=UPI001CE42A61|nr:MULTISPECIES: MarR family transcriptional regulator [unclassified Nocardia]